MLDNRFDGDQLGRFEISVNAVHSGIVRTAHREELFAEMAKACGKMVKDIEAGVVEQVPADSH